MTHQTTQTDLQAMCVLRACFELAQRDQPADILVLARVLGLSPGRVAGHLRSLAARDLVAAHRCRLTLLGLGVAARLPSLKSFAGGVLDEQAEPSQRAAHTVDRRRVA